MIFGFGGKIGVDLVDMTSLQINLTIFGFDL